MLVRELVIFRSSIKINTWWSYRRLHKHHTRILTKYSKIRNCTWRETTIFLFEKVIENNTATLHGWFTLCINTFNYHLLGLNNGKYCNNLCVETVEWWTALIPKLILNHLDVKPWCLVAQFVGGSNDSTVVCILLNSLNEI